jgi:hypothetical protein
MWWIITAITQRSNPDCHQSSKSQARCLYTTRITTLIIEGLSRAYFTGIFSSSGASIDGTILYVTTLSPSHDYMP